MLRARRPMRRSRRRARRAEGEPTPANRSFRRSWHQPSCLALGPWTLDPGPSEHRAPPAATSPKVHGPTTKVFHPFSSRLRMETVASASGANRIRCASPDRLDQACARCSICLYCVGAKGCWLGRPPARLSALGSGLWALGSWESLPPNSPEPRAQSLTPEYPPPGAAWPPAAPWSGPSPHGRMR
jgi:hypothetical protein